MIAAVLMTGVMAFAVGCGAKGENPAAMTDAGTVTESSLEMMSENETPEIMTDEAATVSYEDPAAMTDMSEEASAVTEDASKESTITGKLDEVKDFMLILNADDGVSYAINYDKKPDDLKNYKVGDRITITYTGKLTQMDPFTGTIVSITAAK